jgi:uncharacterized protein YjiS (DUF1127 family)
MADLPARHLYQFSTGVYCIATKDGNVLLAVKRTKEVEMTARIAQPSRTFPAGALAAPTKWIAQVRRAWTQYHHYQATLAEMQGLSDRDLADIGISRLMIRDIAHHAIYGK